MEPLPTWLDMHWSSFTVQFIWRDCWLCMCSTHPFGMTCGWTSMPRMGWSKKWKHLFAPGNASGFGKSCDQCECSNMFKCIGSCWIMILILMHVVSALALRPEVVALIKAVSSAQNFVLVAFALRNQISELLQMFQCFREKIKESTFAQNSQAVFLGTCYISRHEIAIHAHLQNVQILFEDVCRCSGCIFGSCVADMSWLLEYTAS